MYRINIKNFNLGKLRFKEYYYININFKHNFKL